MARLILDIVIQVFNHLYIFSVQTHHVHVTAMILHVKNYTKYLFCPAQNNLKLNFLFVRLTDFFIKMTLSKNYMIQRAHVIM